ncbi:peptide ABC transporter substrate-binding protein [Streptococcus ictaluri]|uniref:Oligopeptide-binding protein SarA n=1 Tax=Streptococcus ictaluri 707-05 TaxID=764299 RepID=G5K5B8_9STRE|nr:peptide ABC transporter substrate-binding protein [Streptococcus ictaluri]EHI69143.1 oligopeptide-binding protein SarA [Streptococcus ictaluri 707-05]
MKKSKWLAALGVAVLSVSVLAACGGKNSSSGSNATKTYKYVFVNDPKSLDYILTNGGGTTDVATQMVDGLLENDKYGNLVPSLAKNWKVSEDGLTYTYTLRDGVSWYTSDGEEYAPVTAEDFVTGLKHAVDGKSEALYVVEDSIKNLKAYQNGEVDFKEVGVKALDDKTVQYTLNKPESYWNSKTTYSVLFPVNAKFLKTQGKDFGTTDPSSILVNGAYFLSAFTSKSSMEFNKNESYWDAKNVNIDTVKLTYSDGSDPGSFYKSFDKGEFSVASLYPNAPTYKSAKKKYADNITYGMLTGDIRHLSWNLNRTAFNNSKKDPAQQDSGKKALNNKDFRQAVMFGFDRAAFQAQKFGEDAKTKALRNMLVPPSFVTVGDENFGDVVEKELSTLGDEWKDVKLEDAQDGFYNPEKAKAEFAKAKEALSAEGVTFPVQLDYPVDQANAVTVQEAQSFKQSVEASLGKENVQVNVIETETSTHEAQGFYAETPEQQDYDIISSWWGPDYQDPRTYLDIISPRDGGSVVQKLGIKAGESDEVAASLGLDTYQTLLDQAAAISNDNDARYTAYAKAQAYLTDSAVDIPVVTLGGTPRVTKSVPFSGGFAWAGAKGPLSYKQLKLQEKPVTAKQYEKAKEKWLKAQSKSNAEYAKKLADHVKK